MTLPAFTLPRKNQGCIMQWVQLLTQQMRDLHHITNTGWGAIWDRPDCTNEAITYAAINLNDGLTHRERQRLWLFIERIIACTRTTADDRINVRLVRWCLTDDRWTHVIIDEDEEETADYFIAEFDKWLIDPADSDIEYQAQGVAEAVGIAATSVARTRRLSEDEKFDWFEALLDQHEKAAAEEGVLHELEDAACQFADDYATA
ncbi:MAG TPA: hypothetical protein VIG24_10210 [Acidimicrobiia bacterium]